MKIQNPSWKVLIGGSHRSDFPQNPKSKIGFPIPYSQKQNIPPLTSKGYSGGFEVGV
jgi:hypothetical protein